ncbi:hypothetical protein KCP71_04395 [Salmonella enterica subsp. enterica]|nr:hypothetical protein KCP71_04395 [Salmonella enterica subsp. enterica]
MPDSQQIISARIFGYQPGHSRHQRLSSHYFRFIAGASRSTHIFTFRRRRNCRTSIRSPAAEVSEGRRGIFFVHGVVLIRRVVKFGAVAPK